LYEIDNVSFMADPKKQLGSVGNAIELSDQAKSLVIDIGKQKRKGIPILLNHDRLLNGSDRCKVR
jgi:hypothetical protein